MRFTDRFQAWCQEHAGKRSFEAKASGDALEINILDVIGYDYWSGGGITTSVVKQALDSNASAKTIRVIIDSPGGSVFDGVGIHSALRRHSAKVTTEVIGLAASAASVIAMAGDTIEMHVGTEMMIHQGSWGGWGTADDLEKTVGALRSVDLSLVDIYQLRTGKTAEDLTALIKAETWMTAQQAVDEGFANRVIRESGTRTTNNSTRATARAMRQHAAYSPISEL